MGLLFWGSGTPTFWLGLLLLTKRESRTPTFKILVRTLSPKCTAPIHMVQKITEIFYMSQFLGSQKINFSNLGVSIQSIELPQTTPNYHKPPQTTPNQHLYIKKYTV